MEPELQPVRGLLGPSPRGVQVRLGRKGWGCRPDLQGSVNPPSVLCRSRLLRTLVNGGSIEGKGVAGGIVAEGTLKLYTVSNEAAGEARVIQGEVVFPDPRMRWTWVLDARHEPYASMERQELLHRADHVRKLWVLVAEA